MNDNSDKKTGYPKVPATSSDPWVIANPSWDLGEYVVWGGEFDDYDEAVAERAAGLKLPKPWEGYLSSASSVVRKSKFPVMD